MFRRALLAALLAASPGLASSPPPLDVLLTGTVADANSVMTQGGITTYCLVNFTLPPGSAGFADNGPSVSFYQQDTGTGPITISFPGLGHGTQASGQAAFWDYFAAGTGRLVFSGSGMGSIVFLPGSVWVPNSSISPAFTGFTASWNGASGLLTIGFSITMGNCSVAFSAVYSD